jgi:NADH-quinone oxidoreductase subunit C
MRAPALRQAQGERFGNALMASSAPRYADAPPALAKLAKAKPRAGLETAFDVARDDLIAVLTSLRDDHQYQQLMEIAGVDYPERPERFELVYCLLSLTRNHRVRIHVATDEQTPVPSVTSLWPVAGWLEREVFDMYGVGFSGNADLRRILTDYGFEGYPQRKDFPLTGHIELRYSEAEKRVVYEPVSLPQDFRNFDFLMPWEGPDYHLPGDEKAPAAPPSPTPKVTEKPSDTGAGKPAEIEATKQARKSSSAKAASEVSKIGSSPAKAGAQSKSKNGAVASPGPRPSPGNRKDMA